jgi:hypothetical protein
MRALTHGVGVSKSQSYIPFQIELARLEMERTQMNFQPALTTCLAPSTQSGAANHFVDCELFCASDHAHLQQIYTGFSLLAHRGSVRLRQTILPSIYFPATKAAHLQDANHAHLRAKINGVDVAFDVHDSDYIDESLLATVDFYFKREWRKNTVEMCSAPDKLFPLGANLWVHPDHVDIHALRRAGMHGTAHRVKTVLRSLGLDKFLGHHLYTPRIKDLETLPNPYAQPRVLFLAEAWDPAQALSPALAQERESMNSLRAQCMRELKDSLGTEVTCGFRATPFSKKAFPDLATLDASTAHKPNYLALVRQHPICIASHGLHQSTGWKFAEYLSLSRAIVSQALPAQLPGSIRPETNYLEFNSAAECVRQVHRLIDQPLLRAQMMVANHVYYLSQLKPCALVGQAIKKVLSVQSSNSP